LTKINALYDILAQNIFRSRTVIFVLCLLLTIAAATGCEAQLAVRLCKHFLTYQLSKLDQTDLVFGL